MASTILILGVCFGTPAAACRVGGDQVLFDVPPRNIPAGAKTYQGLFMTHGVEVDRWRKSHARTEGGDLIGVLITANGERLPVFHPVTSCTHGFYGSPRPPIETRTTIVGRIIQDGGGQAMLYAAGDWNGRWVNVR